MKCWNPDCPCHAPNPSELWNYVVGTLDKIKLFDHHRELVEEEKKNDIELRKKQIITDMQIQMAGQPTDTIKGEKCDGKCAKGECVCPTEAVARLWLALNIYRITNGGAA